jgi:hypothetical protein
MTLSLCHEGREREHTWQPPGVHFADWQFDWGPPLEIVAPRLPIGDPPLNIGDPHSIIVDPYPEPTAPRLQIGPEGGGAIFWGVAPTRTGGALMF